MVTSVPVDASYDFPRTELAAMSNNIARLIEQSTVWTFTGVT